MTQEDSNSQEDAITEVTVAAFCCQSDYGSDDKGMEKDHTIPNDISASENSDIEEEQQDMKVLQDKSEEGSG